MNQKIYDLIDHIAWAAEYPAEVDLLVGKSIQDYIGEKGRELADLCEKYAEHLGERWMLETENGSKFYYWNLDEAHEVGQNVSPDFYVIHDLGKDKDKS